MWKPEQKKTPILTPHQVVDLSWGSAAPSERSARLQGSLEHIEANLHCVRNSYSVHADLVDGTVNGEKIDEVGAERILAGKPDFEALGLDEFDNLNGSLLVCQY